MRLIPSFAKLRETAAVSACLHECRSARGVLILYSLNERATKRIAESIKKSIFSKCFFFIDWFFIVSGVARRFKSQISYNNRGDRPKCIGYFGCFKYIEVGCIDEKS